MTSTPVARWARRLPPVFSFGMAVALAAFILPSALNVPQSNPSETLEYAPIPPTDDDAPPAGNAASLGLGSSGSLGGDGAGGLVLPELPIDAPGGVGAAPRTKRCVGSPPRQTEDPLAPPCVAHFDGDNFGATYAGVTGAEVRVIIYFNGGGAQVTSAGMESQPSNAYFDLGRPPQPNEYVYVRMLRSYQRQFNERYQTYNRFVRFIVHFGTSSGPTTANGTPETRRADASDSVAKWRPFAAITFAGSANDAYVDTMTAKGVVTFIGRLSGISNMGAPASFFTKHPGLAWSYLPSLEQRARLFTSQVCTKVLGHRVSFSGMPADMGKPRRLGFLQATTKTRPDYQRYGDLIRDGIRRCGGTFAVEGTFSTGEPTDNDPSRAASNMATFQREGVTTVIFANAYELNHTKAAAQIGYVPEWVVAGDDVIDRPLQSRLQHQEEWAHARIVSIYPIVRDPGTQACVRAYREADSAEPDFNVRNYGCEFYLGVRQLFTAIQVAGPRLTPEAVDQGFHAIPAVASKDPSVPGCFYEPGDYTCVKDAVMEWWDPNGRTPGSTQPGCLRVMLGGRRFLAGAWPDGDVETHRRSTDPCNAQGPDVA